MAPKPGQLHTGQERRKGPGPGAGARAEDRGSGNLGLDAGVHTGSKNMDRIVNINPLRQEGKGFCDEFRIGTSAFRTFNKYRFTEHLLCVRYCSRHWGHISEQDGSNRPL